MNKLSAEMFEQIIEQLRSDKSRRSNEKRGRPRVGLRCSLDIVFCNAPKDSVKIGTVWVRDLSSVGLGLVSSQSMQPGLKFIASFARCDRGPLHVQYLVAHCKALSKGLYSIGAKLVRVLPAEADNRGERGSAAA